MTQTTPSDLSSAIQPVSWSLPSLSSFQLRSPARQEQIATAATSRPLTNPPLSDSWTPSTAKRRTNAPATAASRAPSGTTTRRSR